MKMKNKKKKKRKKKEGLYFSKDIPGAQASKTKMQTPNQPQKDRHIIDCMVCEHLDVPCVVRALLTKILTQPNFAHSIPPLLQPQRNRYYARCTPRSLILFSFSSLCLLCSLHSAHPLTFFSFSSTSFARKISPCRYRSYGTPIQISDAMAMKSQFQKKPATSITMPKGGMSG